jgi:hypothetical protein
MTAGPGGFEPPIYSLQYTRAVRLAVRCAVNAEHLASCQLDHARMKWSGQRESNPRLLGQTVQRCESSGMTRTDVSDTRTMTLTGPSGFRPHRFPL